MQEEVGVGCTSLHFIFLSLLLLDSGAMEIGTALRFMLGYA